MILKTKSCAYHEAGHAVAALVRGHRLRGVFIAAGGGKTEPHPDDAEAFDADHVVALAGPLAEARASKKSLFYVSQLGGLDDIESIPPAKLAATELEARDLLNRNWESVERVAQQLMTLGALREAELKI